MMLWFALLLLLCRSPGSESRLLPQEQVRTIQGLCDEEAVSDSLVSLASTLFVSRSLLSNSDQFPDEINDMNEQKAKENRVMSENELLSELASIQSPSEGSHLVAKTHHASLRATEISHNLASTPSGGNNLVAQKDDKKNRVPPAPVSGNEILTNLVSTNSVPSRGDHLTVEKNRAPSGFTFESQILNNLQSVPSGGSHLIVDKKLRSPPTSNSDSEILNKNQVPPGFTFERQILNNLQSVPSGGSHLVVEKKVRSPPTSTSESEILNNLGKGSPPSGPSTGNHLTVEKRQRSPPRFTSETEILNNLGKGSPPSGPSGSNHLTVEKRHRSPPLPAPLRSEDRTAEHTETSPDASQKVACPESIWDSLDYMAQQFANSIPRITVYS